MAILNGKLGGEEGTLKVSLSTYPWGALETSFWRCIIKTLADWKEKAGIGERRDCQAHGKHALFIANTFFIPVKGKDRPSLDATFFHCFLLNWVFPTSHRLTKSLNMNFILQVRRVPYSWEKKSFTCKDKKAYIILQQKRVKILIRSMGPLPKNRLTQTACHLI